MSHLILRFGYPISGAILLIFAWVVYQRISHGSDIITLAVTAGIVWVIGAAAFIWFWPRITVGGFKRAIVNHGFGGGPIPINTLYAEPNISSSAESAGSLLATGTDDVLYVGGWLDLRGGPQVLHTPDMAGRYFSVQLTDPSDSANFAYVGKRTTGTEAGDFVLSGPGWTGTVPDGMTQISSPSNSVLVIGRVFVENASDQPAAYELARQIQVTPLGRLSR